MDKTLNINTGTARLLNENSELFSFYDSVNINAGNVIVSCKVYEKLMSKGASINTGSMKIVDITGEIVELAGNTVITAAMSYDGCYLICDGNLIIEDAKGLENIAGLYANTIFRAESVDISRVKGLEASKQVVYSNGAKLVFKDMTLDEDSQVLLEDNTLYWVHGRIKALDGGVIEKLHGKKTSFHCKQLVVYSGLYEKYRDVFQADSYIFVPDGHTVVDDISLDSATFVLYGDKIFVLGDLMIAHNHTQNLSGFSSLIVNGKATMPVSAAADFKAVGKAKRYELYEGALMSVNGFQTLGHEQLQTAIEQGISYTLHINGALYFFSDVTAQDMQAIAAVHCNGLISAPDCARTVLDSKVRKINGTIIDIDAMIKKQYGDDFSYGSDPIGLIKKMIMKASGGDSGGINVGSFKL